MDYEDNLECFDERSLSTAEQYVKHLFNLIFILGIIMILKFQLTNLLIK